jgi:hypothetical protein
MSSLLKISLACVLISMVAAMGPTPRWAAHSGPSSDLAATCSNAAYAKCGGDGYTGESCCPVYQDIQQVCLEESYSYSQCCPPDRSGCAPAPISPTPVPTTNPTAPPTTVSPTPIPATCPGGSLSPCIHLCPSTTPAAYSNCVSACIAGCPASVLPTPAPPQPTPKPAPTPMPTTVAPTPAPTTVSPTPIPATCPGGSLAQCIGLCPSTPSAAYKECISTCVARCTAPILPTPVTVPTPGTTPSPPAPAPPGRCSGWISHGKATPASLSARCRVCTTDVACEGGECLTTTEAQQLMQPKCPPLTPSPTPYSPVGMCNGEDKLGQKPWSPAAAGAKCRACHHDSECEGGSCWEVVYDCKPKTATH